MKVFAQLDQRGFTIVEAFAAMVLFALGILALTRLHMATIQANASAQNLTQATMVAQKTTEDLMARAYNDATLSASPPTHCDPRNPVDGKYTICWNVSDNTPIMNTKTISLRIQWTEGARPRTTSIAFIKGII